MYLSEFHDKGCLEFQRTLTFVAMEDFCASFASFTVGVNSSKCWNSIIVFPSNENGWSSKFQYDIIWPTITLTSIYLQLAFIVIGRAAEILHEIQGKSPWRSMDRRKISPANLLKVRRSGEISSVSSVSVWLDEKFTNYTGANKFRPWVQKAQEVQSRNCFILQE